jgi:hypothetical protein
MQVPSAPFSPQRVIPAQAGIQVRSPFQLAFRGYEGISC